MTYRIFMWVFLSILSTSVSFADIVKVTGRVRFVSDSTSVAGATIRLLDNHEVVISGTTTNTEGRFLLTSDTKNIIKKIEISFVGFVPVSIEFNRGYGDIHIGDVYLIEDSKVLNEVVVSGSLQRINHQLIFPDELQLRASQDVMTLLQNLSLNGLFVDQINKSASIHGKSIHWKINSIPRTLEEIRNLKPNSILRIDYSEMPSMRELDRGYGGVINVILKERTDGGSVRTHLQSALWVGCVNASANVNYHKDKSDFSVDYNSNYRNYPKWEKSMKQEFIGDNLHISHLETPESSPFKILEQNLNLTYIYKPNNKRLFSITWRNSIGFQSNDVRSNIIQTGKDAFHRTSKSQYQGYNPAFDLFFQNTLQNGAKIEANVVGTLSMGKNKRDLVDKIKETVISTFSNPVNTRYHSIIGEITYEKSIHPKVYLNTGLQNKYAYTFNEYLSINRYLDKMHQNNTYLYGQLSGRLSNKVQYQVGTGIKLFHVNKGMESKTYLKNQSAVALFYSPFNSLSLSLNSDFSPYLPTLAQLSGAMQRFDNLSVYTGNRELKPSYRFTNRVNLNYRKGRFNSNFSLNYIYTNTPIFTRVTYQSGEKYFLFYPDNGVYNKQYGCEWKINYKNICDIFSIYTTAGWTRYESNIGNNPLHLNSFYWDASAQMSYKDFVLAMFFKKTGKSLYNETVIATGNNAGITLMWNKTNWTFYAQMMYVGLEDGDTYFTTNYSKVNPYKSVVKVPENGNMLTLGFVWNLDFGKRKNKINRRLNNYDNNESIVKVQE